MIIFYDQLPTDDISLITKWPYVFRGACHLVLLAKSSLNKVVQDQA